MQAVQFKRLSLALLAAIPLDLDDDVVEGWIVDQNGLTHAMRSILSPEILSKFYAILDGTVDQLVISVRTAHHLDNNNVRYIGELVQKNPVQMLESKRYTRNSIEQLTRVLGEMRLYLGMSIKGWIPPDQRNT